MSTQSQFAGMKTAMARNRKLKINKKKKTRQRHSVPWLNLCCVALLHVHPNDWNVFYICMCLCHCFLESLYIKLSGPLYPPLLCSHWFDVSTCPFTSSSSLAYSLRFYHVTQSNHNHWTASYQCCKTMNTKIMPACLLLLCLQCQHRSEIGSSVCCLGTKFSRRWRGNHSTTKDTVALSVSPHCE